MTIKTNEFWIDEPFEDIARNIKSETRLVKFGLFNSFPKTFGKYPSPWIGEINERTQSFKLFRVKSSENTSDLSVVGSYAIRGAKPVVVVEHKLHFTAVFGMVGLLIFVVVVFFLLQKKGVVIPMAIQAAGLVLVVFNYAFTLLKDLRQDEKAIETVLTTKLAEPEETDDDTQEIEEDEV